MPLQPEGLPLLSYVRMVRRRWILVLVCTLAMAVPAFMVSTLETPQYRAVGQILLTKQQVDENFNINSGVLTDTQVTNEVALLMSNDVATRAKQLGATSVVQVVGDAGSNVVLVQAEDSDARRAATTVSAYIQAYSDYRIAVTRQTLDATATQLQSNIANLQKKVDVGAASGPRPSATVVQEQANLQQQLQIAQARLGQLQTQQQLVSSGVTLLQRAEAPAEPVSPTPVRNSLFALVLGLVLGISLAVLLESMRQRSTPAVEPVDPVARSDSHAARSPDTVPVMQPARHHVAAGMSNRVASPYVSNGHNDHGRP